MKYIFLLFLGLNWACSPENNLDENNTPTVIFYYTPSQCAESWQFGMNDAETLANFKAYLKKEGILPVSLGIAKVPEGFISCFACICSSGRLITIEANQEYNDKLLALKYTKRQ
jgi:hypothetical protein